jgi:hypothetical protein
MAGFARYWDMFSPSVPKYLAMMNHLSWADSFVVSGSCLCQSTRDQGPPHSTAAGRLERLVHDGSREVDLPFSDSTLL